MRRTSGFTLMEMMVTVAMIGIVAALAIPTMRAATRNASVSATSFDLLLKLQSLKPLAMTEQKSMVAVFVDAPGNSSVKCALGSRGYCAKVFILANPAPTWTLSAFDPDDPGSAAEVVEVIDLGRGIRLATDKAGRLAPVPFDAVKTFDPSYSGTCMGKTCVAVRFSPNGTVSGLPAVASPPRVRGIAFGIGSEASRETLGAESRGLLVAFPSGIVKGFGL